MMNVIFIWPWPVPGHHALPGPTREIDINLSGPMRMVQQFLPHLKSRADALIVHVSSALAFVPLPAAPVYSATKAGLFHEGCAREMAGQKTMDTGTPARKTIAGIAAGKLELRPGQSNLPMIASRLAPQFALGQMVKALKANDSHRRTTATAKTA